MIATGNHLRFRIRCALQHAPTFVGGHGGYPERDVEGAVPYEGERTRRKKGKCGAMGEVAGGRSMIAPTTTRQYDNTPLR